MINPDREKSYEELLELEEIDVVNLEKRDLIFGVSTVLKAEVQKDGKVKHNLRSTPDRQAD